jgi:hypothetical protein
MPTLLHLSGLKIPEWCEGEVLPSLGGKENTDRFIFAIEAKENSAFNPIKKGTLSITNWPYKLINYRGYSGLEDNNELFDLENDPEELNNLVKKKPNMVLDLKHKLLESLATAEMNSLGKK